MPVLGAFITLVLFLRGVMGSKSDADDLVFMKWRHRSMLASIVTGFVSLFVLGPTKQGVWVNPFTNETTMSSKLLLVMPFDSDWYHVGENVVTPPGSLLVTTVQVTTTDEVPLTCSVNAKGIMLDRRDPAALERFLLKELAYLPGQADYLRSNLEDTLANAAVKVLNAKTSEEISRQNFFSVKIGSPLDNRLSRLRLRWEEGVVGFACGTLNAR